MAAININGYIVLCPLKEPNVFEVRFQVFDCLWWEGDGGQPWGTYIQTLQLHEGPTCITMVTCVSRSNENLQFYLGFFPHVRSMLP